MIYSLALLLLSPGASAAFVGGGVSTARTMGRAPSAVAVASIEKPASAWEGEELVTVPKGVLRANSLGRPWVEQRPRPRRNRKSETMRRMVRENIITPADFIYPLFIHDDGVHSRLRTRGFARPREPAWPKSRALGAASLYPVSPQRRRVPRADSNVPIASMPGCDRHSLSSMVAEAKDAYKYGVKTFVIFPKVPDALKSNRGEEAYNPNGIVPRAVSMLKQALPDSIVCTDVALDPYSSKGHDGIVEDGKILNDDTIEQLCKQVVCQARAGSDVVAPSDMMDGRVGAIRDALDSDGFTDVSILAYTAKYALTPPT